MNRDRSSETHQMAKPQGSYILKEVKASLAEEERQTDSSSPQSGRALLAADTTWEVSAFVLPQGHQHSLHGLALVSPCTQTVPASHLQAVFRQSS